MIEFANAKINIGLQIINKRPDGYHNLETVFYPIPLYDVVEVLPSDVLNFQVSGLGAALNNSLPEDQQQPFFENNLCVKAFRALQERYNLPNVSIFLHKTIPMGAGLGGGSSDAAATLKAVNALFKLKLTQEELEQVAAILGADCPFFIQNQPVFARDIGTVFESISLNLRGYQLVLIHPDLHISTAEAYASCIPRGESAQLKSSVQLPIVEWKEHIFNDFEQGVFAKHPLLAQLKEKLYSSGAKYASMSGSGSCVYGIFDSPLTDISLDLDSSLENCQIYTLNL